MTKYRYLQCGEITQKGDVDDLFNPTSIGKMVLSEGIYRRPIKQERTPKRQSTEQMAAALWIELYEKWGSAHHDDYPDWVRLTRQRLNAALKAVMKG